MLGLLLRFLYCDDNHTCVPSHDQNCSIQQRRISEVYKEITNLIWILHEKPLFLKFKPRCHNLVSVAQALKSALNYGKCVHKLDLSTQFKSSQLIICVDLNNSNCMSICNDIKICYTTRVSRVGQEYGNVGSATQVIEVAS